MINLVRFNGQQINESIGRHHKSSIKKLAFTWSSQTKEITSQNFLQKQQKKKFNIFHISFNFFYIL